MKDAYPLFNPSCRGVIGGAEVDLYFLSRELAKKKSYRVRFFVGDYGQPDVEVIDRVTLVKLKYSDLSKFDKWYHRILRRIYIIKELFFDASHVLITKTASDTLGFMILINKFLKRKNVLFKFGSDIDADPEFWRGKNLLLYLFYKYSIRFVDYVICQTEAQQKLLDSRLYKKSLVIKNGFPIEKNRDAGNKEHILWVSRYDYMKRPEIFIKLARSLPQERFLMVMPGSGEAKNTILSEIQKTENLTLIDNIPFRLMQDYFDRAKCFVNTSKFEGFPNTFIQACLGSTPILSFSVNPDNFINEYSLGCFSHGSPEKAVDFIKSLDEDKILYYGNNALRYATENHDLKNIVTQYEKLINTLVHTDI
jgi:glycosyltransferase involved in cell wall biosynthesis